MIPRIVWKLCLSIVFAVVLFATTAGWAFAQGQSGSHPPQGGGGGQGSGGQTGGGGQGAGGGQGSGGQGSGGGQGSEGQGSGGGSGASGSAITKKDQKKLNKDANKLGDKAEQAANELGRDVVFCILSAHTTDVGTAQQLKDKFNALTDIPFGQFVAAVIMADRIDKPLDDILKKLEDGESLGQISKEFDVDVSELRQGFGDFRSELARSMTNPPTKDCFKTAD